MRYGLYPFQDDESATIWDAPFDYTLNPNLDELTNEQRTNLLYGAQPTRPAAFTREQIAAWSEEAQYQFLWDHCTLLFNSVAIVSDEHEEMLRSVANRCFSQFGGDSSTYQSVAIFNEVLKGIAVKVISIPVGDLDREGEFEYK